MRNLSSYFQSTLILLFPLVATTQLGKHFWPQSSFVYGIRVDYLSPTLFLLDLYCLFWLAREKSKLPFILPRLSPIALLLLISLLLSTNPLASAPLAARVLLYASSSLLLTTPAYHKLLTKGIYLAVFFQLGIGLTQSIRGTSIGGVLYWLGERPLSLSLSGVARGEFFGSTSLRAYGTFSHPNTLAGWLVGSVLTLSMLNGGRNTASSVPLLLIGLGLTQSRLAALASLVFLTLQFFKSSTFLSKASRALSFFLLILLIFSLIPLSRNPTSISERLLLMRASQSIFLKTPYFGSGLNASISSYPSFAPGVRLLQPDHSLPTLLLSQLGIFGLASLLLFLRVYLKHNRSPLFLLPLAVLILGDHYLLTSPQGLWLLTLILSLFHPLNYRSV